MSPKTQSIIPSQDEEESDDDDTTVVAIDLNPVEEDGFYRSTNDFT
jgi:hypothetical protein